LLHRGIDEMIREIDASSSRLSLSLLLAALIIGSSLLMLSGQAPFLFGFPLLGLIGYLLAGCLGIWLIISFLRRGRF
ncbi:MAG: ubiquinone biosynthesis protein UbiB, partial [Nitrospinota bacterium]